MKITRIPHNFFGENGYFITEDGVNAIAVDPGDRRALQDATAAGLAVKFVLLTHGHYDHIMGCGGLQGAGAKIGCLAGEEKLACGRDNVASLAGVEIDSFAVDFTFSDGEVLDLCGLKLEVIATPGHTAGSCCFRVGDALFTGDTLFRGTIGRTDLPTGNGAEMKKSLARLAALEGNPTVYAGHEAVTTLDEERANNLYLK